MNDLISLVKIYIKDENFMITMYTFSSHKNDTTGDVEYFITSKEDSRYSHTKKIYRGNDKDLANGIYKALIISAKEKNRKFRKVTVM